jgi:Fur family ferric uptake transcriptional regulator
MTRNNIGQLLLAKGIKPTTSRLKILAACIDEDIPLDVDDVAKKVGDKAHLATVYRTLEKLVSAGLLERIDFQEGKFRYEYVHDHHHHAVCDSCGKVEDVTDAGIEAIESRIKKESGFLVTKHAIELFGFCNTCQSKGSL